MRHKGIARKIIVLTLLATMLLFAASCGKKKLYNIESATEAVAHMGAGWSLGNTLDAFNSSLVSRIPSASETCWGNPVATKELFKAVDRAGFKTVRIPVTWYGHVDEEGKIDEEWLDRVQEVVDYGYSEGLYVILNMHHDSGEDEKAAWIFADTEHYNKGLTRYKAIWTQIAERFADYDGRLLFEGYNEMLDKNRNWNSATKEEAYDILNRWAQVFVDAVRATGGNNANRNLIVSTYAASFQKVCLDKLQLPQDSAENHLLAEVHMYSPWEFCDSETGVKDKHTVFTKEYEKYLDQSFADIEDTLVAKGIPVVVGEFAATNKNNTNERVKYTEYYVEHCKRIGASYIWWDNGVKKDMGLFSRSTYECWFPEIVDAIVK